MAKRSKGSDIRTAQPLRTMTQRAMFLVFLGSAVAIMVLGRSDPHAFERARTALTDVVVPLLDTLSRPIDSINDMVMNVQALGSLYEENKHLRREVSRLKQWESVARHIEVENAQMRDLLRFRRDDPIRVITGRIVGMGGTFVRSLTLNRGMNDGVQKGQVAVTGDGLIGRVAETGQYSSRILLVTDLNSRVPVLVENSLARAILAGDNTALPRLIYGAANSDLQPGQRVVTSGDAGVFPPGLPVGQIVSANENGVRVHLFAANERPELVRLMDFGKTGILGTGIQNAEKLR